ncbi:MAG: hypothetical protein CBD08_001220 [Cellvibrionales bacterium TMED148]|nr:hypothetical protein [Porticoccaceae bacterium]RPG93435.1 MAG: hypothetical protein CBD08_001220 [Cellvibrionales bacterium TMED148]
MLCCEKLLSTTLGFIFLLPATTVICSSKNNIHETILSASGTIFCDGFIRGSGLHIDKSTRNSSIIMTAAHVMYDKTSDDLFEQCSYRPNNMRLQAASFADISMHGYTPHDRDKIKQSENDIAFVALSRQLSQPSFHLSKRSANLKQINSSQVLKIIRYNDTKNQIEVSKECGFVRSPKFNSNFLIFHDCPTGPGASGASIIDTSHVKLIGIHGGTLLFHSNDLSPGKTRDTSRLRQGRIIDEQILTLLEEFKSSLR